MIAQDVNTIRASNENIIDNLDQEAVAFGESKYKTIKFLKYEF